MIWNDFLNSISFKYKIYFKNDKIHLSVFENALKNEEIDDFIHVIESSLSYLGQFSCLSCKNNNNESSLLKITNNRNNLIIFFQSYFCCNIEIAHNLFKNIKPSIYSIKGMHLYDLSCITHNKFTLMNKKLPKKNYYCGIIFNKEKNFLMNNALDIILKNNLYNNFALYGVIGTTLEPVHFYAIYINKKEKILFLYNSCLGDKPFYFLSKFETYKIFINKYKHQYNNDLCGFYSLYFLVKMGKSQNEIETFNNIFNKPNLNFDKYIENEEQKNYIFPSKDDNQLIGNFIQMWKGYK